MKTMRTTTTVSNLLLRRRWQSNSYSSIVAGRTPSSSFAPSSSFGGSGRMGILTFSTTAPSFELWTSTSASYLWSCNDANNLTIVPRATTIRQSQQPQKQQYRTYISRAHPKPTPIYNVFEALKCSLDDASERCNKRLSKWNDPRSIKKRQEKWNTNPDHKDKPFVDTPYRNQNETVEFVVGLNLDPRRANQVLRGSISLKHGTGGPKPKIAVFTSDKEVASEALKAGATYAGRDDLIEQIKNGDIAISSIDRSIATHEMPSRLSKIGRVLGPRGLMPNPKLGNLLKPSDNVIKAVERQLAGLIQYRVDKFGNIHVPIGKVDFGLRKLADHIQTVMNELVDKKPEGAPKGKYLLRTHLCTTQGKSYKIDISSVDPGSSYFMIPPDDMVDENSDETLKEDETSAQAA